MTKQAGLIGYGAIGRTVMRAWHDAPVHGYEISSLLVRQHQIDEARSRLPAGVHVTSEVGAFLEHPFDLVVEAAGQSAVVDLGEKILAAGVDLMILSVGALANRGLSDRLRGAAIRGDAQILVPVGAIAGLDGLLALRRSGLRRVLYTSTKPPVSWKGTAAERAVDLDAIGAPTVLFEGSAREAAALFPKNANLAATVALAGLGLDETRVVLIADPGTAENEGCIEAETDDTRLQVTVSGKSEPGNPKSSRITGLSVLSALENEAELLRFL